MEDTKHQRETIRYLPTYEGCYVCGQSHPRGLRLRFFVGDFGQVCARFVPDGMQTGYSNVVHGGVISALLDELLGWPIALQTGRVVVTGELTVRFLKPMDLGQVYLATADPGSERGKYWTGTGEIRDGESTIYASARGKYFLLSSEQTAIIASELTYQPGDPPVFRYGRQQGRGWRIPGQDVFPSLPAGFHHQPDPLDRHASEQHVR